MGDSLRGVGTGANGMTRPPPPAYLVGQLILLLVVGQPIIALPANPSKQGAAVNATPTPKPLFNNSCDVTDGNDICYIMISWWPP